MGNLYGSAADRLKEALREFEIDYFVKHGTFDSCGQPTGLEDGKLI